MIAGNPLFNPEHVRRAVTSALPIFTVTSDTVVRHTGTLAGQWRWMRLVGDRRKHWWCERAWFV